MHILGYSVHGKGALYLEDQHALWARNKWQRTHALHIRPMEEP
jgi:hypothetical protein